MLQTTPADLRWLAAAARLAQRGRPQSRPNPCVGAIIVKDGIVVGRGWTQAGGRPHAEAIALAQAGDAARGAVAYVTLEPCAHKSARGPACADILAASGLARVVIGQHDPDPRTSGDGIALLAAAGIEAVLCDDAPSRASLAGYLTRAARGRPFVTLKLALSLDGKIAMADGSSKWITGETARAHVHAQRARYDAILVGGETWRADQPRLDVRLPGLEARSPERWVLTRGAPPDGVRALASPEDIVAMEGVHYLYVEGGAGAAAAFLASDLVDRIDIYRAPIVIGSGIDAIGDIGLTDLEHAHGRWSEVDRRQLGSDCFTAYERTGNQE